MLEGVREQPQLLLPEPLSFLDGIQQLLFQLLVALVGRQVQTVEAVTERNNPRRRPGLRCPASTSLQLQPASSRQTHHVWLLGSQVSLPTLSMQNFWGPLLPVIQGKVYFVSTQMVFPKVTKRHSSFPPQLQMPHAVLPQAGPQKGRRKRTNELSKSPNRQAAGSRDKLQ